MSPWQLILSAGAKRLVTLFIVLGVLFAAGQGLAEAIVSGNVVTPAEASKQVQADAAPAGNALNNYSTNVYACGNSLPCVTSLDRRVAATLNTFASQIRGIDMPSDQASAAASALAASATHLASIFSSLGAATSATQYLNIAKASGVQQAYNQLNQDYANLMSTLHR